MKKMHNFCLFKHHSYCTPLKIYVGQGENKTLHVEKGSKRSEERNAENSVMEGGMVLRRIHLAANIVVPRTEKDFFKTDVRDVNNMIVYATAEIESVKSESREEKLLKFLACGKSQVQSP